LTGRPDKTQTPKRFRPERLAAAQDAAKVRLENPLWYAIAFGYTLTRAVVVVEGATLRPFVAE
jgi:hypothetical protein